MIPSERSHIQISTEVSIGKTKLDLIQDAKKTQASSEKGFRTMVKSIIDAVFAPIKTKMAVSKLDRKIKELEDQKEFTQIMEGRFGDAGEGRKTQYKLEGEVAKLKSTNAVQNLLIQNGKERFKLAESNLNKSYEELEKRIGTAGSEREFDEIRSSLDALDADIARLKKQFANTAFSGEAQELGRLNDTLKAAVLERISKKSGG